MRKRTFVMIGALAIILTVLAGYKMNSVFKDKQKEITVFEELEPVAYEKLKNLNLINHVELVEEFKDIKVNVEEIYYDSNIITTGIRLNYTKGNTSKYNITYRYKDALLSGGGAEKQISSEETILLHKVALIEPLPQQVELTLELDNGYNTYEIDINIDRSESDQYIINIPIKNDIEYQEHAVSFEEISITPYCTKVIFEDSSGTENTKVGMTYLKDEEVFNYLTDKRDKTVMIFPSVGDGKNIPPSILFRIYDGGIDGTLKEEIKTVIQEK